MGKKKNKKFKKLAERRKQTMGLFNSKKKSLNNEFEAANKAIGKAIQKGTSIDLADNRYWSSQGSVVTSNSITQKGCGHTGDFAITLGKTHLFGAAASWAEGEWELVLDCANLYHYPKPPEPPKPPKDFVKSGPEEWVAWGKAPVPVVSAAPPVVYDFPIVRFDWPDMTAPWVGRDFWKNALDSLPAGDVLVCCMGGHGRTGTALASLMVVSGKFTAKVAMAHLRKNYCSKAVETKAQEQYLESLEKK